MNISLLEVDVIKAYTYLSMMYTTTCKIWTSISLETTYLSKFQE